MDPFVELISLLRPRATLWRRIDGVGRWGVGFRKHDDLLFCWVAKGECWLERPSHEPLHLTVGDFVLVRTSTPFSLVSTPGVAPVDSETAFALPDTLALKVGKGAGRATTLHGGRFVFDSANEDLLTGLLPPLVRVDAEDEAKDRIRTYLRLNAEESLNPRPGAEFVVARLMELVLVELLRNHLIRLGTRMPDLLTGLADPVVAPALRAMHDRITHPWTVVELARLAGVSRSSFAARFHGCVGEGPIEYLLNWRMALAKDDLRQGRRTISETAFAVGFQSVSAFSAAFRRRVGIAPGAFVELAAGHERLSS